MILLFTDFGLNGPYVGQMKAAIAARAPGVPVIDLMHDAPAFQPQPAAYLLAALIPFVPAGAILVGVVDPGVGTDRAPVLVEADGRCFIGPGNGLFELVCRRARQVTTHRLAVPDGQSLSASFHGRDLFAPAAAERAAGRPVATEPVQTRLPGADWPEELDRVIHIDAFGNCLTGRRAATLAPGTQLYAAGQSLKRRRTFGEARTAEAFWYENSLGLAELAAREASAAALMSLRVGDPVQVLA
ncbi:MAG: S-adenosyl-l-methionine hydroxide adenosyltransferase family protein [Rhodothalassiaceae bacterium]